MDGQQIGSYRVERKLGEGGMGVVYVGVDVRLGRRAAIKQLLPSMSGDRTMVERFFNEAKAAASINHPGIVEIYDVGWHTDGSAYFAMKLLDGDSLARRLRAGGPLPVPLAATIARQIASALGAAHQRGIVHRDLKPDNVVLVPDEEVATGARATLLDFGIAKLVGDGVASSKTRTGSVMGTPYYMSPEQCRGAGEVDHRTDVYALGCMLFEMLTGRPPFVAEGAGEILGMHQFVDAPAVRAARPDVPPELDALVARMLGKRADVRPQSMAEVSAALQPFATPGPRSFEYVAQQAPVQVAAPTFPSTLSPRIGDVPTRTAAPTSRRAPLIAIGAIVLVAAAVVVAVVASGGGTSEPTELAAAPTDAAASEDAAPPTDAAAVVVMPVDAAPAVVRGLRNVAVDAGMRVDAGVISEAAQRADALNEEGKGYLLAKPIRAADASAAFRAAIGWSPEARFFLNLCMSLYHQGRLEDALEACEDVPRHGGSKAQNTNATKIIERFIRPKLDVAAPPKP